MNSEERIAMWAERLKKGASTDEIIEELYLLNIDDRARDKLVDEVFLADRLARGDHGE